MQSVLKCARVANILIWQGNELNCACIRAGRHPHLHAVLLALLPALSDHSLEGPTGCPSRSTEAADTHSVQHTSQTEKYRFKG